MHDLDAACWGLHLSLSFLPDGLHWGWMHTRTQRVEWGNGSTALSPPVEAAAAAADAVAAAADDDAERVGWRQG